MIKLVNFPMMHAEHSRSYRIWVNAEVTYTDLKIRFKLEGAAPKEFNKIILPADVPTPKRMDHLWEQTCFECFIPSEKSNGYLEFNGSVNGCWNLFAFQDYRKDRIVVPLDSDSEPRQNSVMKSERQIECEWLIPLAAIQLGFISINENHQDFSTLGFSSVLNTNLATMYWALKHDGVKPDFHLRSSFTYPIHKAKR